MSALELRQPLGPYLTEPHRTPCWYTNIDATEVYRPRTQDFVDMYDVFLPQVSSYHTQSGYTYTWSMSVLGTHPGTSYASVQCVDSQPLQMPTDFWPVLRSFDNQSFWDHFVCGGDREWIHRGLLMGSLTIVHDGSYMPHVSESVCSAAIMIRCSVTKLQAKGSIVEYSASADNYRGEILGGWHYDSTGTLSSLKTSCISLSSSYHPL